MLDFAHALTLRRICEGDVPAPDDETEAVWNLSAAGLVARGPDGVVAATEAGRAALAAGVPSRWERWSWRALVLCLGLFAVASIVDRVL